MKKFSFRLEKVLHLRGAEEENAKIELGKAVSALNLIEKSLETNKLRFEENGRKRSSLENSASLNDFYVFDLYSGRLQSEKAALEKQKERAEEEVAAKTALWTEAKANLKALENLKERQFKEYKKEYYKDPV